MTTTKQASTSLVMPSILAKYMLKSQCETLTDGTKQFVWKGFISSMDAHLFYLASFCMDGMERNFKHHVIFSGKGDEGNDYSWHVKQNYVPKGDKFYVTFELLDYTMPAQTERIAKKLVRSFELANHYLAHVILHPEDWHDHQAAIESAKELVYYSAQNIADYSIDL